MRHSTNRRNTTASLLPSGPTCLTCCQAAAQGHEGHQLREDREGSLRQQPGASKLGPSQKHRRRAGTGGSRVLAAPAASRWILLRM